MNVLNRRRMLVTRSNPDLRTDFLVELECEATMASFDRLRVMLRYVPDRLILEPACLDPYLAAVGREDWLILEAMVSAIRDDINNEAVPRWLQVLVHSTSMPGVRHQRVAVEDRQPGWDNPSLLQRLPLF